MEASGSSRDINIDEDPIGAASATSVEEIIDALARRGCSNLTVSIDSAACSEFACAGGGLCDVYKGELDDGTRIAIKTLRIYGDSDKVNVLKNAARELYHWSKLQHSNVLPLMGLTIFRGHVSIVSEWMEHGNLMSYLKLTPSANRIKLCMDICEGLCYIHTSDMVHGDLKAANIMVSSNGNALIADFGNAELRDLTLRFTNTSKVDLSVRWAAPELLLERSPQMSKEADVYAFGMTILEVLTGKLPFQGTPEHRIVCLVAYGGKVPPRPDIGIRDDLWDILNWCWTREPAGRPVITNIKDRLQGLFQPPSDAWSIGYTTPQSQGNELNPGRHNGSGNEAFSTHADDKEDEEKFIRRYMWSRFGDQDGQTNPDDDEEGSEEEEASEEETESSRGKSDNLVPVQERRRAAFASTTPQRSLFCQCNKTPCQCWPSTSTSTRPRTQSRSQPPAVATLWHHYNVALPPPHTPAGSYTAPLVGSRHSPNLGSHSPSNPASAPPLTVPAYPPVSPPNMTASSPRSPLANQIQLHSLFKASSILRTPELPATFRVRWDVRDSPTSSVILSNSNHEPEYLYEHPAGVASATSPPVPYLLVACNDALPWLTPVHAKPGSAGVTVRDVLEAISAVLYTQVEANMLQLLPNDEARNRVYRAYYSRVERNGADNNGIRAVDYLGDKSLFVCLERNEALARKRVKEESMWPYVFALKLKVRKGALVSDA